MIADAHDHDIEIGCRSFLDRRYRVLDALVFVRGEWPERCHQLPEAPPPPNEPPPPEKSSSSPNPLLLDELPPEEKTGELP